MDNRTLKLAQIILGATLLVNTAADALLAGGPTGGSDRPQQAWGGLQVSLAASRSMVEHAIEVLDRGWEHMNAAERAEFIRYYDPGHTGQIDEQFVRSVRRNYVRILRRLETIPAVEFAPASRMCRGMRLFYTDFMHVFACPFLLTETNPDRVARDLVHETAHMALLVVDRAYYYEDYTPYEELTPRGHWTAQLPLIGHLLREIARADTQYHPEAYARFAAAITE